MLNQTTTNVSRSAINSSDKILFQKNVLTYLKQKFQLLNTEMKKETNSYLTSATQRTSFFPMEKNESKITNKIKATATVYAKAVSECDCNKATKLSDEYASIWKSGFFTLAFITTFISMLIIITLGIRILCTKSRSKPKNNISKAVKPPEKNPKQSCSSFLDYDTGICTMSSSINCDASKSPNLTSASSNSLSCKLMKKQSSLLNNDSNRCLIYGISNKMILDDISSFYNFETSQINNGPFSQHVNTIPSSFKPCSNNNNNNNNNIINKSIKNDLSSKKKKLNSKSFNDILVQPNEYSAIENSNSLCNLSGITSYSEVSTENNSDNRKKKLSHESDVNFHYLNTNELISSTSILTEELESKLKERRQMIEIGSIKCKPQLTEDESFLKREAKIFIENDKHDINNENLAETSVISLPNCKCVCPCHIKSKPSKEQKKHQHYRRLSSISSVQSDKNSLDGKQEAKNNHNDNKSCNDSEEKKNLTNNKKAKIIIDSSLKLPTKRESIRLLIENKAVTENKQKGALECHLKKTFEKNIPNFEKIE